MPPSERTSAANDERPAERAGDAAPGAGGGASKREAPRLAAAPLALCLAALASAAAPELFAASLWYRLTDAAGPVGRRAHLAPAAAALCHLSRLAGCAAAARRLSRPGPGPGARGPSEARLAAAGAALVALGSLLCLLAPPPAPAAAVCAGAAAACAGAGALAAARWAAAPALRGGRLLPLLAALEAAGALAAPGLVGALDKLPLPLRGPPLPRSAAPAALALAVSSALYPLLRLAPAGPAPAACAPAAPPMPASPRRLVGALPALLAAAAGGYVADRVTEDFWGFRGLVLGGVHALAAAAAASTALLAAFLGHPSPALSAGLAAGGYAAASLAGPRPGSLLPPLLCGWAAAGALLPLALSLDPGLPPLLAPLAQAAGAAAGPALARAALRRCSIPGLFLAASAACALSCALLRPPRPRRNPKLRTD